MLDYNSHLLEGRWKSQSKTRAGGLWRGQYSSHHYSSPKNAGPPPLAKAQLCLLSHPEMDGLFSSRRSRSCPSYPPGCTTVQRLKQQLEAYKGPPPSSLAQHEAELPLSHFPFCRLTERKKGRRKRGGGCPLRLRKEQKWASEGVPGPQEPGRASGEIRNAPAETLLPYPRRKAPFYFQFCCLGWPHLGALQICCQVQLWPCLIHQSCPPGLLLIPQQTSTSSPEARPSSERAGQGRQIQQKGVNGGRVELGSPWRSPSWAAKKNHRYKPGFATKPEQLFLKNHPEAG